jgi:hypothetical protein
MTFNLDNTLKHYFQKNVQLTLKNKPYKKGKLINYRLSGCYVCIILLTEKKKETFEIPFPYTIKVVNDKLIFDYTLEALAEQDYELLINLKSTSQVKKCKFYNTVLAIIPLN